MNQPLTRTRLASSVGALLLCALGAAQAGDLGFALVPDALPAGVLSPEGCFTDAGLAHGKLGAPLAGNTCHSGLVGNGLAVFVEDPEDPQAFVTADFTSEPFSAGLALLGPMALRVHAVFDPVGLAGYLAACGGLLCEPLGQQLGFYLDEVRADGAVEYLAGGSFPHVPYAGVLKQEPISGAFDVGPHRLAPGSRLRLRLYANEAAFGECDPSAPSTACAPPRGVFPYVSSVGARLLYGGEPLLPGRIKDSAVSFAVASAAATAPETDVPPTPVPGVDDDIPVAGQPAEDDAGPGEQRSASGGSLPVAVLAVLAVFGALRLGRGARRARQPAFEVR